MHHQVKTIKFSLGRMQLKKVKEQLSQIIMKVKFETQNQMINFIQRGFMLFQNHLIRCKRCIRENENTKLVQLDDIPIKVQTCVKGSGIVWQTNLFNNPTNRRMRTSGNKKLLSSIYRSKGDIQNWRNYRHSKLMSYTMKLWKKITE